MTNWKHDLEHSEPHWFSEWEQTKDSIARQPGVYTVWDKNGRFLYVGTAWGKEGLRGRLSQHARGARHQDKFSVDIADRCLLRGLCRSQIDGIDAGDLKFDNLVKEYVRDNLAFRYTTTTTKEDATSIETAIKAGRWPASKKPLFNPTG